MWMVRGCHSLGPGYLLSVGCCLQYAPCFHRYSFIHEAVAWDYRAFAQGLLIRTFVLIIFISFDARHHISPWELPMGLLEEFSLLFKTRYGRQQGQEEGTKSRAALVFFLI